MKNSDIIETNKNTKEENVYCNRCGRLLKGQRSKELGYGPSCYYLWKKERSQQIKLFDEGEET